MFIRLEHLDIGYGGRHRHIVATDLNFVAEGGQLTCLLGRNGTGKSTLLRTLAGLQRPLGGRIVLEKEEGDEFQVSSFERQSHSFESDGRLCSVVLTDRIDDLSLSVEEVVAMGRMPYTGFWGRLTDQDRLIVSEAMATTGIDSMARKPWNTLSDGERQKVLIAKALAQQTPLMLLDEPTAFLDHPSKIETFALLKRLAHEQGKIIILSTHDLELARQWGDHFWEMSLSASHAT